jgi:HAD superfamily hydrolase (TIGR01509 family)
MSQAASRPPSRDLSANETIRGLVFDFDGLILDTEGPVYDAWCEVYRDHDHELALDQWVVAIGTHGGFDPYTHLESLTGKPLPRDEVKARVSARVAALLEGVTPRPGVVQYLDDARRLGLRVGLASSSNRTWVEEHLRTHGLLDRFEALRCRGDVAQVKPAPDLYLAAVEALGISPAEAIALEDSPNGVKAAKAAGMFCAAVPHGPTAQLDFSHADAVLPSLAEVPLPQLLQRASRIR